MKIKVCHIITKLELGGAQGNTLYTVSNLNKNEFDAWLVTGRGGILDEKTKNIKTVFIDSLVREISPLKDFISFIKIYKLLKKTKPDIVHTHSSKAGIIARFAAKFAGIKKIIHTYHGFGFNDYQNFFVKHFYIFIEKLASSFTDSIIFVSKENIKTALKYGIGNPTKYKLIRSGIKLKNLKKEKDYSFLRKLGIIKSENSVIISTVANLKPQKNPEDFFFIASEIIKEGYDAYFIYAGGGELLDYFRKRTLEQNLEKRIHFTGWIEDPSIVYSSSDIFILTSLWEGLPRSLVEAMAFGVVPVCYKTDGVNDIIEYGVNGFSVEIGDRKKMAELIKELIKNRDLYSKLLENLKKIDLIEFDIDYMVRQQEELYKRLEK